MKACTSPQRRHKWVNTSFETQAGSQPVRCERCGEEGFRLNPTKVPAQKPGSRTRGKK